MPSALQLEYPLYTFLFIQCASAFLYYQIFKKNDKTIWLRLWRTHALHILFGFWPTIFLILLHLFRYPVSLQMALDVMLFTGIFYLFSALVADYKNIFAPTRYKELRDTLLNLSVCELFESSAMLSVAATMLLIIDGPDNALVAGVLRVVALGVDLGIAALIVWLFLTRNKRKKAVQVEDQSKVANGLNPGKYSGPGLRMLFAGGFLQSVVLPYVDLHSYYGWWELFCGQMVFMGVLAWLSIGCIHLNWWRQSEKKTEWQVQQ